MKIVCCSDSHRQHRKVVVPEGDIFLFAGDIGLENTHNLSVIEDFDDWLGDIPCDYKICVAGNHDWLAFKNDTLMRVKLSNAIYLRDQSVEIEGFKIYGSATTPEFCGWAFMKERGPALKKHWSAIPDDTNILITHGPSWGIRDEVYGERVGDWDLLERVGQLDALKLHVFGHLHGSYGMVDIKQTKYVNASVCTESYAPSNQPIIVEL